MQYQSGFNEKSPLFKVGLLLPDLDSNQDKQNQNLMCYRYTIGQFGGKKSRNFHFGFFCWVTRIRT
jgi:hypothetical protein